MSKKSAKPVTEAAQAAAAESTEPTAFGAGGAPLLTPEDASVIEGITESDGTTRPLNDSDIMEGFGMSVSTEEDADAASGATAEPGEAAEDPLSPDATVASPEVKKYRVLGREFDSAEAMAAFVDGQQEILNSIKTTPAAEATPEVNLEEFMFENPKEYTRLMKEQAKAEIRAELDARDAKAAAVTANQKTWADFYKANPDLADFTEIVDKHFEEVANDPKTTNLPTSKGLELIAKRARDRVNAIKLKLKPADELPATRSGTIGSTAAAVSKVTQPTKASSFSDEIRGLRKGAVR